MGFLEKVLEVLAEKGFVTDHLVNVLVNGRELVLLDEVFVLGRATAATSMVVRLMTTILKFLKSLSILQFEIRCPVGIDKANNFRNVHKLFAYDLDEPSLIIITDGRFVFICSFLLCNNFLANDFVCFPVLPLARY